ncbi:MAG: hypothetical protein LBI42_03950, partial [Chitinispirillales bacterium]|nr:hypothetical protein [Chitinispirillales bacterium]
NNLADAVTQAVKECIDKNILKTFLNNHGSEVTNMLLTEWKFEDALKVREEEAWEAARKVTRKETREETLSEIEKLLKQGVTNTEDVLKELRKRLGKD